MLKLKTDFDKKCFQKVKRKRNIHFDFWLELVFFYIFVDIFHFCWYFMINFTI